MAYCGASIVALTLGACVPSAQQQPVLTNGDAQVSAETETRIDPADAYSYTAAEVTVREGLNNIMQRYIDPVDMDTLALGGLHGLSTIDPNVGVDFDPQAHELRLDLNKVQIARLPVKDQMDAASWAHLSSETLRTFRTHSPEFQSATNERVFEAMFDGMLSNLDTFSRYAGAEEAQANRARRDGFGGIGIRFTQVDDGILITHVAQNSPAFTAGVKPGDMIAQIDDTATTGMKLNDVAKLLRGPVGSLMALSVKRLHSQEGQPDRVIAFSIQREHIVPETVNIAQNGNLLTIRITSFNKNTATTVHDALRTHDDAMKSGAIKGIVMDLRGNPGGLLSQSVSVADLFLEAGNIISTRGRHPDSVHDYKAGGVDLARGLPLAILVDGDSASAAEIVASALQDLGRAVVIGSASYGKGTVQTVIRLPNDGEVTLTWSRFVSPSGYAIQGLGVMPAVCATNAKPLPVDMAGTRKGYQGLTEAILKPEHIDGTRDTLVAWRATGMVFDDRRRSLRDSCPSRTFKPGPDGDLLMSLAERVIRDQDLYRRALLLSQPLNTASR